MPKASWGHLFQSLSEKAARELTNLFHRVTYSHRVGSVHLKRILEGHHLCPEFQAGMHATRAFVQSGHAVELATHDGPRSWFRTVRKWLCDMGWQWEGGVHFHAPGGAIDLSHLDRRDMEHLVREQWRRHQHEQYKLTARREVPALQAWAYDTHQVKRAIKLYNVASAEGRAVFVWSCALNSLLQQAQARGS